MKNLLKKNGIVIDRCFVVKFNKISTESCTQKELNDIIKDAKEQYFNWIGQDVNGDGEIIKTERDAHYIRYSLEPYKTKTNECIYAWKSHYKNGFGFGRMVCGTESEFKSAIVNDCTYSIGQLKFETLENKHAFLRELANIATPETWGRSNNTYSILEYYLMETTKRTLKECDYESSLNLGDGNFGFDSGLYTENKERIFITGIFRSLKGYIAIYNPKATTRTNVIVLGSTQWKKTINLGISYKNWNIAFNNYIHKYKQDGSHRKYSIRTSHRTRKAVSIISSISKENIVSIFNPDLDEIQIMIPHSGEPDCAISLTVDNKNKSLIPTTIWSMKDAYLNARLVVKPGAGWLNIENINE